jgi:hypothetical protein
MSDSDRNLSENPYAYYETENARRSNMISFSDSAESGEGTDYEPRMPIHLELKKGTFGSALLEVTADQCMITSDSLQTPIVILRDDAPVRMRFKNYRLIVRNETGRKFSFRYKRNASQELFRARLETWSKQRWHDAAEESYKSVHSLLKKHVMRPVFANMVILTILHLLALLSLCSFILLPLNHARMEVYDELTIGTTPILIFTFVIYAIPAMITFGLSLALGMRQVWALYVGVVFSFFPTLFGFWGIIGILINVQSSATVTPEFVIVLLFWIVAVAVTISFLRAIIRFHRQQKQLENENRESLL